VPVGDPIESALRGRTIFISRSREECAQLCDALESRGVFVIASPLLRFALSDDLVPFDAALKALGEFDWWLITSQHAVEFAAARAHALRLSLPDLVRGVRIGVVGPATADAARHAGLTVEYVAKRQSALGLAEELAPDLSGKRVLLLRSNLADSELPAALRKSRAHVTAILAYRTLPPPNEEKKKLSAVDWRTVAAAVFFSPSAIRHFAGAIGPVKMEEMSANTLAVTAGATTLEAVRSRGFANCIAAAGPSSQAILETLEENLVHPPLKRKQMTGVHRA